MLSAPMALSNRDITRFAGVNDMKILNVYRSEPDDAVKKLVEVVSEGNETDTFDLAEDSPNYDELIDKLYEADKAICWW